MRITEKINFSLLFPAITIYFLGFISIYSTTKEIYLNHLVYFGIGILIFSAIQFFGTSFLIKYSHFFYIFVLLLLLSLFFVGSTSLGATRWLKFGGISIQPSEIAKMVLIFMSSSILISDKSWPQYFQKFRIKKFLKFLPEYRFVKLFFLSFPLIILVLVQPDLGTTLSLVAIFLGILMISNFPKKYLLISILIIGIFSNPIWNLLQEYQRERVLIFLNPEADPYGSGYNSIQAKIAVGSGGILGKGYAMGTQTQLNFLPIFWTDFLVATYAEEWGFVGIVVFLLVYFVLIYNIYKTSLKANREDYKFLSSGIFMYFVFQFSINFGMNIGIFPVTGIPIPLFSYGGTALVISFTLLGILNYISLDKSL